MPRPSIAAKKIDLVGYERLRIYFRSRRDSSKPGNPFQPGVTYRDILKIYEFDAKLRSICFDACGQFEILFRNSISESLSRHYGGHPYTNIDAFRDASARREFVKAVYDVYLKTKDARAKHYLQKYKEPNLPPIWMVKELITFGSASRIYPLLSSTVRSEVAKDFGHPKDDLFAGWIRAIVDLRNACAHHDRIFNKRFVHQPVQLKRAGVPTASPNTLKALLECLDHLLVSRGLPSTYTAQVTKLLTRYPEVKNAEVGF